MLAKVIGRPAKLGFKADQKVYVCGNLGMIYENRVMRWVFGHKKVPGRNGHSGRMGWVRGIGEK